MASHETKSQPKFILTPATCSPESDWADYVRVTSASQSEGFPFRRHYQDSKSLAKRRLLCSLTFQARGSGLCLKSWHACLILDPCSSPGPSIGFLPLNVPEVKILVTGWVEFSIFNRDHVSGCQSRRSVPGIRHLIPIYHHTTPKEGNILRNGALHDGIAI